MKVSVQYALSISLLLLGASACSGESEEVPQVVAPQEISIYDLRGEVKRVDLVDGLIHIHHEEIPGYMEEMTMPFDIKGQDALNELAVGDLVTGKLMVSGVDMKLSDLVKAQPVEVSSEEMPSEEVPVVTR